MYGVSISCISSLNRLLLVKLTSWSLSGSVRAMVFIILASWQHGSHFGISNSRVMQTKLNPHTHTSTEAANFATNHTAHPEQRAVVPTFQQGCPNVNSLVHRTLPEHLETVLYAGNLSGTWSQNSRAQFVCTVAVCKGRAGGTLVRTLSSARGAPGISWGCARTSLETNFFTSWWIFMKFGG